MMLPLYGHSELVIDVVRRLIPNCQRGFGPATAIGVIDDTDGGLVGGVVYHNWCPEAGVIEMSGAAISKKWLTRPVIRAIFDYPFRDLECQMVVFRVAPSDLRLRRILGVAGGVEHVIPRLRGRNEADVIVTVTDDDYRNSKIGAMHYGKARLSEAA